MKILNEIVLGMLRGILITALILGAMASVHMAYKAGPNYWWFMVFLMLINLPKCIKFVWSAK